MKHTIYQIISMATVFLTAFTAEGTITPNDFKGSDSERIEAAIKKACETGERSIEIPRLNAVRSEPIWLIDRAVLLPNNFTLVLSDCLVRLASDVKDNIIRNAGAQMTGISSNKNITIQGFGKAVLSGRLKSHYAPKSGANNGWRTMGILLCAVDGFTIDNITIQNTQAWGDFNRKQLL